MRSIPYDLLNYLTTYFAFPSRIYIHEFVQSLYIRACNTQYAIIIIYNSFSRIHWWLRKSRSLKAGRRVSVEIRDGLSSPILSSSLSFPGIYARLPRLSSYSCGSTANRWIRYIAFVSSLSSKVQRLSAFNGKNDRTAIECYWHVFLDSTNRDSIAIQSLFNCCLFWMHTLMITV